MKAGRELDALVAENVMGAHVERRHGEDYFINNPMPIRPLPHYSTSIADAWLVVEKLSGEYAVSLSCTSQPTRWLCEFSRSENVWANAHGKTPQHAICLAALKIVGVEVKP